MNFKIKEFNSDIVFIEVDNGKNIKVVFSNYGASVFSLHYDNDPMILEFKDKNEFLSSKQYYGKTLGVVAGRMPCDGELDGKEYHLVETDEGTNFCLHGGAQNSISYKPWKYSIKDNVNEIKVIFDIKTKRNENGFPGSGSFRITYILSKTTNKFKIKFNAKTNNSTFVNLSNHIYWNFNRSLNLNDYSLKMNAPSYGVLRNDLLIIGLDDVPLFLDFTRAKKLKSSLDFIADNVFVKTIDNTFLFDGKGRVVLKNNEYKLQLDTDYPAMNIYLDSSMTPVEFANRNDFKERRGIALEPQLFGYNIPSTILRKGNKYQYNVVYSIKKIKK